MLEEFGRGARRFASSATATSTARICGSDAASRARPRTFFAPCRLLRARELRLPRLAQGVIRAAALKSMRMRISDCGLMRENRFGFNSFRSSSRIPQSEILNYYPSCKSSVATVSINEPESDPVAASRSAHTFIIRRRRERAGLLPRSRPGGDSHALARARLRSEPGSRRRFCAPAGRLFDEEDTIPCGPALVLRTTSLVSIRWRDSRRRPSPVAHAGGNRSAARSSALRRRRRTENSNMPLDQKIEGASTYRAAVRDDALVQNSASSSVRARSLWASRAASRAPQPARRRSPRRDWARLSGVVSSADNFFLCGYL